MNTRVHGNCVLSHLHNIAIILASQTIYFFGRANFTRNISLPRHTMKLTIAFTSLALLATMSDALCWTKLTDDAHFLSADGIDYPEIFRTKMSANICNEQTAIDVYANTAQLGIMCVRDAKAQVEKCGKEGQCCTAARLDPIGV